MPILRYQRITIAIEHPAVWIDKGITLAMTQFNASEGTNDKANG